MSRPRENRWRQAGILQTPEAVLLAQKVKQRKDQLSPGPQMGRRFSNHPVQDRPPVRPPIVGRCLIPACLSIRRSRHLWRIRQDQLEGFASHRREQIAEPHIHLHFEAIQDRVAPRAPDASLHDIGGHHSAGVPRGQQRKEARAGPEIEDPSVRQGMNVTGQEECASFGDLSRVIESKNESLVRSEERRVGKECRL